MANDKVWSPLNWKAASFADTAAKLQVGDVVRNPFYDLPKRATKKQRDRAQRVADRLDQELAARGLRIDHTNTIIGFVERMPRRSNPSLTTSYAFDPSMIRLDHEPSDRERGLYSLRKVVDRLWEYRELSGSGELNKVSEYEDPDKTYIPLQYIRPLSRVEASMVDDPIAYLNDARGSKSASANRLLDLARRLLVTERALSYSDYSQASYVEANVDTVIEMVDEGELHEGTVVETSGGYGSRGVLLRIWREEDYDSVAEIIGNLASYPVLDENRASEREFEKTVEAVEDFVVSEFSDMLRSELEDLVEQRIEASPKDENAIVAAAEKYERIIDNAPLAEWLMNNDITDYAYEESEGVYVDLQRWVHNYPGTMQDILEEIVKTYG